MHTHCIDILLSSDLIYGMRLFIRIETDDDIIRFEYVFCKNSLYEYVYDTDVL